MEEREQHWNNLVEYYISLARDLVPYDNPDYDNKVRRIAESLAGEEFPECKPTRDHIVKIRERYEGRIDFDKWLEYKDDDLFNLACKTIGLEPNSFKYEEEGCMSRMPQVDYDRLRVGDLLWYRNIEDPRPKFEEVVITHLYGGVVFLRYTKRDDKNEFWLPKESFGYYLGLYPKKVILPKGTKCTCDCELTEFEEES